MIDFSKLQYLIDELHNRHLMPVMNNVEFIRKTCSMCVDEINKLNYSDDVIDLMYMLLHIGNIVYNNTDLDDNEQPIDNEIYDYILTVYSKFRIPEVGAITIEFTDYTRKEVSSKFKQAIKILSHREKELFFENELIGKEMYTPGQYYARNNPMYAISLVSQGNRLNTKHEYPELVGTLKKAKFVLESRAEAKGVLYQDNMIVLERDFFRTQFEKGLFIPTDILKGVISLKYDGCSVEATIKTVKLYDREVVMVVSARTRGDAIADSGKDITHVLYGYIFYNADPEIFRNELGVKFEAVMTYSALTEYNSVRKRNYVNPRSAISSIVNSDDGWRWLRYVTLVPLETSVIKTGDVDRLSEIEFMNTYLATGEPFRYAYIEGDFVSFLYQINKFTDDAEIARGEIPIMYDGTVFEYTDNRFRQILGRKDAINLYAIAIKFNPMVKFSKFRGYKEPKIGVNGVVTPMLHFDPIDFLGGIHDHSSGHSFSRINSMNLRLEDWLRIEYVNEVMPYAIKADDPRNELNTNPIEPFPERCPYCGNIFKLSKSSKTLIDDNINCIARRLAKTVNMIDKLDIKDFAEASVEKLKPMSFSEMVNIKEEDVLILGEANSAKFLSRMKELRENPIEDYKILGALGFTNIAIATWQKILAVYTIHDIIYLYKYPSTSSGLEYALKLIKGIGNATAATIIDEMPMFIEDIEYISRMSNVITSRGFVNKAKIVFSGFRDNELVKKLDKLGYDATKDNVTKDTHLLILSDAEYRSGNRTKAEKYDVPIITLEEFEKNMNMYL